MERKRSAVEEGNERTWWSLFHEDEELGLLGTKEASEHISLQSTMSICCAVGRPYFTKLGGKRRQAWTLLTLMLILLLFDNFVTVYFSYLQNSYSTALQKKDAAGFYRDIRKFFILILSVVPLVSALDLVKGLISIEWRRHLTSEMLQGYLGGTGMAYYNLKVSGALDNPDQRICQDVKDFVDGSLVIFSALVSSSLALLSFSSVLYEISPLLFCFIVIYATAGTFIFLQVFGIRLMTIQRGVLQKEASMRFALVRVRESAEAIAFYQGAPYEAARCSAQFGNLLRQYYRKLRVTLFSAGFQRLFSWITWVLPALVIAPAYFKGEVEFGVFAQSGFAFNVMLSSLTVFIENLDSLSGLGACAGRIQALQTQLKAFEKVGQGIATGKRELQELELIEIHVDSVNLIDLEVAPLLLRLDSVSVITPNHSTGLVVHDLSFRLHVGQSLLIKGRSGIGKSSLLRAICGLWRKGTGFIRRVESRACFFVPQHPYLCLGTLRQQALYPQFSSSSGIHSPDVGDEDVANVLKQVQLAHVLERHGLHSEVDWSTLSLGEQQRLGFARLLLRPGLRLAILDEGTSALDEATETRLYELLQAKFSTGSVPTGGFMSVGHRVSLDRFHSHVLHLRPGDSPGCHGEVELRRKQS